MNEEKLRALERLNQLELTCAERERVLRLFADRKLGEDALAACDTADVERMVHVVPLVNVLREDSVLQAFSREELLSGAPEQRDGYWQVPRLVD